MCVCVCVCVCCSISRNDVPRVAQRFGTIAALTRRRASVLDVCVVFCVHIYSFAGLIRRTPPPTFSDTAITTQIPLFSSSELTGCGHPGLLDRKNLSNKASTLSTRQGSPPLSELLRIVCMYILPYLYSMCHLKTSLLMTYLYFVLLDHLFNAF